MILRFPTAAAVFSLLLNVVPAVAATSSKDVVGSKFDSKVQTRTGSCVRTRWDGANDVCGAKKPPAPLPPPAPYIAPPAPKPVVVAPPAPPVVRTVIKKEARTIYFDSGKSTISPAGQTKLDQLAETLKGAKDIQRAEIVGYADPMGPKEYNQALSERRTKAVEDYLNDHGYLNTSVAKSRAVGEDEASADCSGKMKRANKISCLKTDRKVEIEVVYASRQ